MNDFENRILNSKRFGSLIKHLTRYVEGILIVWSRTNRQIDLFPKGTNAMHKDIEFTVGKGNKTINYLNLTRAVTVKRATTKSIKNQPVLIPLSRRTLPTAQNTK